MGERKAERADVVRFLCGTASGIEMEARAEDAACASTGVMSAITPKMREAASALVKAANAIERGDHVQPVERTPEVVLRAMLRAYEEAALQAARRWWLANPDDAAAALAYQDALQALDDVMVGLAGCLEGDVPDGEDFLHSGVGQDYEARLRGDRPLDAPPAEV